MKKSSYHEPAIESDSLETLSLKLIKTTAALARTNAELKAARSAQLDMLANISHDLRAPIAALRSSLDLLNSDIVLDGTERRNLLALMDRRTHTLETLINDLYLLFSLKVNHAAFHFEAIDAAYFLNEYYLMTKLDQKYEERDFTLTLADTWQATLNIDIQRLILALDNLVGNAWKFTAPGGRIALMAAGNPDRQTLTIEVADDGIGIPADSLERIFDYTYTVSSARTPAQPPSGSDTAGQASSGLGLSIVKGIAEAHHGRIDCRSQLGRGSVFSLTLPAEIRIDHQDPTAATGDQQAH